MRTKIINKREVILWYFLKYPTRRFHLRELSRISGVSFPWTRKIVGELAKQRIIIRKKERNLVLSSANFEKPEYKVLKRSHNLISIYKSGLVEYLVEITNRPEAIILFGSYEKGDDTEKSDVDIAVISNREPKLELNRFEKRLLRNVSVKMLPRKKIEKEFWNALANGTILYGYLELP